MATRGRALWIMMLLGTLILLSATTPFLPFHETAAYTSHSPILIIGNSGFTSANGVSDGNGTTSSPYIIEDWNINAYSPSSSSVSGIAILHTDKHFVIRNVRVHDGFTGVYLLNVTNGLIENVVVSNNRGYGVNTVSSNSVSISDSLLQYDSLGGVWIAYSTNINVWGNVIRDTGSAIGGSAILVEWSNRTSILRNAVSDNPSGILVYLSGQVTVGYNYLRNHTIGVNVVSSWDVNVTQNGVWNNGGGISLSSSNNASIFHNHISHSGLTAISVSSSKDAKIYANEVSLNDYGISVAGSTDISVYWNNLLNNTVQASDSGASENSWNATYPSGGNFWSNYSGLDLCGGLLQDACDAPDGVGDTPHSIDSDSGDNYPLMVPFIVPDTGPPGWPLGSSLEASNVTVSSVLLNWTPATDNLAVEYYGIFQGDARLALVTPDTYTYLVSGLAPGTSYDFRVEAADAAGNWSTGGPSTTTTTIMAVHDVAVIDVTVSPTSVIRGEPVSVSVVVQNKGNVGDSFVLTIYSDGTSIDSRAVEDLPPRANLTLSFTWDTRGVRPGTYTLRAGASVLTGEIDVDDNTITGPAINISPPPNSPPVLDPVGPKTVEEGTQLVFTVEAVDAEGDAFDFSLGPGAPAGASITPDGVFTWTPSTDQGLGSFTITIIVSDGSLEDSENVTVIVVESTRGRGGVPLLDALGPFWWGPIALPVSLLVLSVLYLRGRKKR